MPTALYIFLTMMLVLTVVPLAITIRDVLECRKNDKSRIAASCKASELNRSLASLLTTRAREIVRVPVHYGRRLHPLKRAAVIRDSRLRTGHRRGHSVLRAA